MLVGYTHIPIYRIRGKISKLYCYGTDETTLCLKVRLLTGYIDEWITEGLELCPVHSYDERIMYYINRSKQDSKCMNSWN